MSWKIDSAHSQVQFTVRHMMISNVRGRFEDFSGTIEFNEEDPTQTKIDVVIDAASINTREAQRDGHLKSADFLNVEEYPSLRFVSNEVRKVDANHYRIIGDLTIRGITKEVVLEAEYAGQVKSPWGTVSAGFSAHTRINRTDWGLVYNAVLETGGILVGEEVKIDLELELIKQEELVAA
jgi:polyisoprenoid-binding protein YceI